MSDDQIRCEASFEIEATPAEAWRALEEVRLQRADPDASEEWWLPGFHCRTVEIDRDEGRKLTVRKAEHPCMDTIIDITFEHTDTGSVVRVTQSGFDQAFIDMAGEAFWTHAQHIFADLHLFFDRGIVTDRAWMPWTPLGMTVTTLRHSVRMDGVMDGSWAANVGLLAGDLLLTVHGAPIYSSNDLGVIERVVSSGDDVAASWLRDGNRIEATATI